VSDEPTPYFPDFAGALALLFSAGFPGIALLTQVLPVPLDLYTLFEEATVGSGLAGFALAPLPNRLGLENLTLATNGVLPLLPGGLVALGLRLTAQGVALTYRMVPAPTTS